MNTPTDRTLTRENAHEQRQAHAGDSSMQEDFEELQRRDVAELPTASLPPVKPATPQKFKERVAAIPTLSKPAALLLDRAIQTTLKNRGQNLPDVNAKARLANQATLLEATNGLLAIAAMAIMETPTPDDLKGPDRRPNRVFSLLYGVMRSVVFNANGALRRWLDPRPQFTPPAADGVEVRAPAWGLAPENDDEDFERTLKDAVEELSAFFAAIAQACGFSLDNGDAGVAGGFNGAFPLCYDTRADGSFEPISDFNRAMDLIEVKRQASLKRRADQESTAYTEATKRALELMAKAQHATAPPAAKPA